VERKVLLSPIAVRAIDWEDKRIEAALTKAQVEKSPDIDTISRSRGSTKSSTMATTAIPVLGWIVSLGRIPIPIPIQAGPDGADLERERAWNWKPTIGTIRTCGARAR